MGSGYLCNLIFTLSKFTLKNFIFFEMMSDTMVSPSIFLFINMGVQASMHVSRLITQRLEVNGQINL